MAGEKPWEQCMKEGCSGCGSCKKPEIIQVSNKDYKNRSKASQKRKSQVEGLTHINRMYSAKLEQIFQVLHGKYTPEIKVDLIKNILPRK